MQFVFQVVDCLKQTWPRLVVADLLYKLLAFMLLTPLLAALFRILLSLSGNQVLSDTDIALFFAGPFGWLCAIVLGAVWLAIVAMEQSSLLWMLATRSQKETNPGVLASVQYAVEHASSVLRVSARLVGWSLLFIAPFLLIAGGVYIALLADYDINYYLAQRPREFQVALIIGAILAIGLAGVLLRLYSNWFLVIPLVLFEEVAPRDALETSKQRVVGHRRRVVIWLALWAAALFIANVVLTYLIGLVGSLLIPESVGSLPVLATRVGLMLMVMALGSLVINLVGTIGFAGMLYQGYLVIVPNAREVIDQTSLSDDVDKPAHTILTKWRITAGCVVGVLVSALIGYLSLNSVQLEDDVEVMAHRGSSFTAPENTLAAFRQAIEEGADWIELDVQETVDGEVVVMHDSDFMKLSSNPLKIWDAKLHDLSDIDIGTWFDPKFSDQRVPKLAEVLRMCKDKIGVNIELKYYGHDQQLEQRVIDIVENEGMAEQVMIMSLDPEGVKKTKALRPNWMCGLLLSVYVGDLEEIQADFLAVNASFATRNFVKRAHNAGKQVFVWTVNDPVLMSHVMNDRVDGILTDRPDLAREVLRQRAEMSLSERLLTEVWMFFGHDPVIEDP